MKKMPGKAQLILLFCFKVLVDKVANQRMPLGGQLGPDLMPDPCFYNKTNQGIIPAPGGLFLVDNFSNRLPDAFISRC